MIRLTPVTSLDDIRGAISVFNDGSFDRALALDLLGDTQYWVQNPEDGNFGPGKFCGFQNLSSEAYRQARDGDAKGARFNGTATK